MDTVRYRLKKPIIETARGERFVDLDEAPLVYFRVEGAGILGLYKTFIAVHKPDDLGDVLAAHGVYGEDGAKISNYTPLEIHVPVMHAIRN